MDGKAFGQEVVAGVKRHLDTVLPPVVSRMDEIERLAKDAKSASMDGQNELREQVKLLTEALAAVTAELQEVRKSIPAPVELPDFEAMLAKNADGLEARIAEAVSALPAAKDGKDADMDAVKQMVADAVSAIPAPKDGTSVTLDDVAPLIAEEVAKAAANIPPAPLPSDEHLSSLILPQVVKAVEAIPRPLDGKSVTVEELAPLVAETVERAVAAIPAPKDGRDGLDVKDMFRADGGRLVAVMSDGTTRDLGVFVGKDGDPGAPGEDGNPGRDGLDGVGFDDLDVVIADDGVAVVFEKGGVKKAFALPVPIDRGVYNESTEYRKGNGVTWGGQFWIAQKDTPNTKPGDGDGWRLSVKKGRDARPSPVKVGDA